MTDFSSLDKLMEFGLGLGLAQQMMRTVEYSLNSMTVPGVGNGVASLPTAQQYYAIVNGAQSGPLSTNEVNQMVLMGHINVDTLMWTPGLPAWCQARDIPEVYKIILLNHANR